MTECLIYQKNKMEIYAILTSSGFKETFCLCDFRKFEEWWPNDWAEIESKAAGKKNGTVHIAQHYFGSHYTSYLPQCTGLWFCLWWHVCNSWEPGLATKNTYHRPLLEWLLGNTYAQGDISTFLSTLYVVLSWTLYVVLPCTESLDGALKCNILALDEPLDFHVLVKRKRLFHVKDSFMLDLKKFSSVLYIMSSKTLVSVKHKCGAIKLYNIFCLLVCCRKKVTSPIGRCVFWHSVLTICWVNWSPWPTTWSMLYSMPSSVSCLWSEFHLFSVVPDAIASCICSEGRLVSVVQYIIVCILFMK